MRGSGIVANGKSSLDKEGCEFGRMLKKEVSIMQRDVADIIDRLQNRPSWSVATIIIVMSNLVVGLAVALLK
ncbi:hypothetical protein [Halocella sp. SP3-1]|uniref:hypothetical protein n=1 Tax=Halocella sp. SP3-1 TaxID=2382161 RepID=UPI000F74D2C6|nr:hypothetical protein [Halocella sp. SP3-1]AZO95290.1 hypothetical protein D7D81_12185 [Halocella sp. SP3-1]